MTSSAESGPTLELDGEGTARLEDPSLSADAWLEMSNFPTSLMCWR